MSQWTHVVGALRIDGLPFGENEVSMEEYMGVPAVWNDNTDWDKCTLPCGSEGSLRYQWIPSKGEPYSVNKGILIIWGDLRDYEDVDAIYEWIKKKILELPPSLMLRQMSFNINVECKGNFTVLTNAEGGELNFELKKL